MSSLLLASDASLEATDTSEFAFEASCEAAIEATLDNPLLNESNNLSDAIFEAASEEVLEIASRSARAVEALVEVSTTF
jgi:hypothetical protein